MPGRTRSMWLSARRGAGRCRLGVSRWPALLPGLTVDQAGAPHDTMVAVVVAALAGAVPLFPALALLFTLTLRGHLGAHTEQNEPVPPRGQNGVAQLLLERTLGARLAVALLIVGIGLLNVADAPWAHAPSASSACSPSSSWRLRRSCPGAGRGRSTVSLGDLREDYGLFELLAARRAKITGTRPRRPALPRTSPPPDPIPKCNGSSA